MSPFYVKLSKLFLSALTVIALLVGGKVIAGDYLSDTTVCKFDTNDKKCKDTNRTISCPSDGTLSNSLPANLIIRDQRGYEACFCTSYVAYKTEIVRPEQIQDTKKYTSPFHGNASEWCKNANNPNDGPYTYIKKNRLF
jgi:hypothetical protein